jgi:PPM family protein phosphatase
VTRLDVVAVTHHGVVRDHNEDTIAVDGLLSNAYEGEPVRVIIDADRPIPCLVADGLGGHAEGARASGLAAAALADAWARFGDPDSITMAIEGASKQIFEEMRWSASWTGMATTLAGIVFCDDRAICVNVGDSRCYRLHPDGSLEQISTDDSPPLPPGAPPDAISTIVTQTLGGTPTPSPINPHLTIEPIAPGDQFLLCSDGLTDYQPLEAVEACFAGNPDNMVIAVGDALTSALAVGGRDNVSIVLITVIDVEAGEA